MACAGVTLGAVADALGVRIASGAVRGRGISISEAPSGREGAPVGFATSGCTSGWRVTRRRSSGQGPGSTERYCVVYRHCANYAGHDHSALGDTFIASDESGCGRPGAAAGQPRVSSRASVAARFLTPASGDARRFAGTRARAPAAVPEASSIRQMHTTAERSDGSRREERSPVGKWCHFYPARARLSH